MGCDPGSWGCGWELRAVGDWSKQAVSERAGPWAGLEGGKGASGAAGKGTKAAPRGEHPGNGGEKVSKTAEPGLSGKGQQWWGPRDRQQDEGWTRGWGLSPGCYHGQFLELAFIAKNNFVGILNNSTGCLSVYVKECS